MKAAQITQYGGKDALVVTDDVNTPTTADGEVLVEVHAAAVNPFDIKVREGFVRSMKELSFPATLGGDVAGIVTALGEGVEGFEIGQEVYGQAGALSGHGSFAEYAPVKASQLAAKPQNCDFAEAAALPLVSCSAYQALIDHMQLQAGQKILVHGGAGGIGSLAIQLAKNLQAYVITTAAGDQADYVRQLGADEVIDYIKQDFSQLLEGLDAVFDTVGGETNRKSYQVLKSGGTLVSMVDQPDETLVNQYAITYVAQFSRVTADKLNEIAKLVDQGILSVHVDKTFSLDEAPEALEYLKTGHAKGKVVIQVNNL